MRLKKLVWTLFAILSLSFAGLAPATATDLHRAGPPAGYAQDRVIKHHVYYPRYQHVYQIHGSGDPYAYRPAHRHYYPYYNSGYWRAPQHKAREHLQLPKYYPAWGRNTHGHDAPVQHKSHGHFYPWHW
jgi:hypothetical protein